MRHLAHMNFLIFFSLLIAVSFAQTLKSIEFSSSSGLVPSHILTTSNKLVLIAEKNTGKLHLFRGENYLHSYPMSSGLRKGSKFREGDLKTPVGVYLLEKHLDPKFLSNTYYDAAKLYGSGALTLNYPNPLDQEANKTGNNIWIHGTDNPNRIKELQSSRGCVVVHNETFLELLSLFNEEKMPLIIVEDLEWISKDNKTEYLKRFNGLRVRDQWFNLGLNKYIKESK